RPNLMKIAPIMEAYRRYPDITPVLVHTGQHYDPNMNQLFFEQLGIPKPDVNLGVGSGMHGAQTAAIMQAFEPILESHAADAVVVVGDVNGTMACALVAAKLGVPLVHVEAGLRSFDRTMPEEINRVVTDAVSDILLCSEESGVLNLKEEGVNSDRIHFVGNVMIDALLSHREHADQSKILFSSGVSKGEYALVTLHRPANVDDGETLGGLVSALEYVGSQLPVVFPVHPRTRQNLERFGLLDRLTAADARLLQPLGYLDFLKLTSDARIVLTDSGGIQEETTILGVPCLTLRHNTERPVTVELGTNRLVGNDPDVVIRAFTETMSAEITLPAPPPLWDGKAADRIVEILAGEPAPS
ncbi:MAG: non-hydrolyzing UDP-N-acetylglucosamine 2-epimerase, partial [Rhodothermia bacterium]